MPFCTAVIISQSFCELAPRAVGDTEFILMKWPLISSHIKVAYHGYHLGFASRSELISHSYSPSDVLFK